MINHPTILAVMMKSLELLWYLSYPTTIMKDPPDEREKGQEPFLCLHVSSSAPVFPLQWHCFDGQESLELAAAPPVPCCVYIISGAPDSLSSD